MAIPNTYALRLPLTTISLVLVAGLLIYILGSWQADQLAKNEGQRLGNALAAQLAQSIRQPIIHNDLVSLQVSVDQLVAKAEVAGATVYNPQEKLIAQSGIRSERPQEEITRYREALIIENKTAAFAGVDINTAELSARYHTPLNWILAVWLIFGAGLSAHSLITGRRLSLQLKNLCNRLPSDAEAENSGDELTQLSDRLTPLLTQSLSAEKDSEPTRQIATVALHCKNLDRLEAQLSKENLQRLLRQLDDDLAQIVTLYHGERSPGREQTLFIEFTGDRESGDHPLRALCSVHLLLKLAERHAQSLGVGLALSAAVRLSNSGQQGSLMGDFDREKRESEVIRLARLAERNEILLDSATSLHHTLQDVIAAEEVSESSDLYRLESFSSSHQSLLEKQFRYLISQ
ncbi:hypothetical protein QP938_02140 [Porticoccaceae bacterium LTM1]|nr:hypothetical protein QP938_02140 [Porticoccaceae bacterium LTM1]